MTTRRRWTVALAGLVACTACESQDAADPRAVKRLCGLPADAAVMAWSCCLKRQGRR